MRFVPLAMSALFFYSAIAALGQSPMPATKYVPPKPSTSIPATGIHLTTEVGSFKIKRGSENLDYGILKLSFKGTVLISGLQGTATPGNGAALEFSQPKFKKDVYFSKSVGTLTVSGHFAGIQFFGQNVNAYYRGDGVIQMFGEFDKNLNTGLYWYDQSPNDKKFWGTNGMTLTPQPYAAPVTTAKIKIKNVTGKE